MTEGERWVVEALQAVRAAGYAPDAIRAFLVASERRAAATRVARPEVARQSRIWAAVGATAWAVPAALGVQPLRRRVRAGLAWWGLTALMLDWHLGMVETEDGEPCPLGGADACTLARAWLVPLAAERPTPLVCCVGFGSDALDGWLARRSRTTRAGRDLEGVADTAFAAATLLGAVRSGGLGRAPAAGEAARLVCGVALTTASYFGAARRPSPALARAGRPTAPLRAAGLLGAALGRRRTANALVAAGALAGLAASVRQAGGAPRASVPPTFLR